MLGPFWMGETERGRDKAGYVSEGGCRPSGEQSAASSEPAGNGRASMPMVTGQRVFFKCLGKCLAK